MWLRLRRWLQRALLPVAPPVAPLDLDADAAEAEAAERARAVEAAEARARAVYGRLRQLEERLRYYDRREGDG